MTCVRASSPAGRGCDWTHAHLAAGRDRVGQIAAESVGKAHASTVEVTETEVVLAGLRFAD